MCNLYSIRTSRAALARKFRLRQPHGGRRTARRHLPGHMAPIIKQSADGERELVMRSWGLILLRDGYACTQESDQYPRRQDRQQGLEGQLQQQYPRPQCFHYPESVETLMGAWLAACNVRL